VRVLPALPLRRGADGRAANLLWAQQIRHQLDTYKERVRVTLGDGWEQHPDGQKLKKDIQTFNEKLQQTRTVRPVSVSPLARAHMLGPGV
jgi:hypothetical protein